MERKLFHLTGTRCVFIPVVYLGITVSLRENAAPFSSTGLSWRRLREFLGVHITNGAVVEEVERVPWCQHQQQK